MGQQELLVLVLGIVIVGLAVYAGMDAFYQSSRQRHADVLLNHAMHVASEAFAWRSKVSPFLGGGGNYSNLGEEGMARLLMTEDRIPGIVRITRAEGQELEITAVSTAYSEIGIWVRVVGDEVVETKMSLTGEITLPDAAPVSID